MAVIHDYLTRTDFLSRSEVVQGRKELFRIINDDALFPIKSQPDDMKMIFGRNL